MLYFSSFLAVVALQSTAGEHPIYPSSDRVDYESKCGSHLVSFSFHNFSRGRSAVNSVKLDGLEVTGAAKALTDAALNRKITGVVVRTCGFGSKPSRAVLGTIQFLPEPLALGGRPQRLSFELTTRELKLLPAAPRYKK